jgi:hypothetical protein
MTEKKAGKSEKNSCFYSMFRWPFCNITAEMIILGIIGSRFIEMESNTPKKSILNETVGRRLL